MNEVTPGDPIRTNQWPEMGRLPNWNDERSLGTAKLHVLDNLTAQVNRGQQPAVILTPIVGKCLDAAQTGLTKSGIEALNFCVKRASEPIAGMQTPRVVQGIENYVVDSVVIMIGKLAYVIVSTMRSLAQSTEYQY